MASWMKLKTPILVKAKYSLLSPTNNMCLALVIGDILVVTQECGEWYYGHSFLNGIMEESGIFPKSYAIEISDKHECNEDCASKMKQRMQSEIMETLHEWLPTWRDIMMRTPSEASKVKDLIRDLLSMNRNILTVTHTLNNLETMNKRLISKIDFGNELLKHDLVPRKNGTRVALEKLSFAELYDIHEETMKRNHAATHRGSIRDLGHLAASGVPYRVQVSVSNMDLQMVGELEMVWSLRDRHTKRPLFEPCHQFIGSKGNSVSTDVVEFCFEELYLDDDENDLTLDVVIYRRGNILQDSNKKSESTFRRPIGMAGTNLKREDLYEDRMRPLKILPFSESDLPKFIAHPMRRQQSVTGTTSGRKLDLRMKAVPIGEAKACYKEMRHRMLLKSGRRAVLDRDRLFVELISGEYEKANKTSAKNVEVRVSLRNTNGKCLGLIENSTDPYVFASGVLYHNNSPEWREVVQINLQQQETEDLHVFFEFYHCTTRDKRSDERNLFGYCALPLHDVRRGGIRSGKFQLWIQKADNVKEIHPNEYICREFVVSDTTSEKSAGGWRDMVTVQINSCSTLRTQNESLMQLICQKDLDSEEVLQLLELGRKLVPADYGKPELMRRIFYKIIEQLTVRDSEEMQMEIFLTLLDMMHQMEESSLELKELEDVMSQSAEICVRRLMNQMTAALKNLLENHLVTENDTNFLQSLTTLLSLVSDSFSDISRRSSISVFAPMSLDLCLQIISSDSEHLAEVKETMWREYPKMLTILAAKILPEEMTVKYCQKFIEIAVKHFDSEYPLMTVVNAVDTITKIGSLYCYDLLTTFNLMETFIQQISQPKHDFFSLGLNLWCNMSHKWHVVPQDEQRKLWEPLLTVLLPRMLADLDRLPVAQTKAKNRIIAIICSLFKILFGETNALLACMSARHPQWKITCQRIFTALEIVAQKTKLPDHWFTIKLERTRISLHSLVATTEFLFQMQSDDLALWHSYFVIASSLLLQDCLQLAKFPPYKRHKIMENFGDLRVTMRNHMQEVWKALDKESLNLMDDQFNVLDLCVKHILPLMLVAVKKTLVLFCGFLRECCKRKPLEEVCEKVCDAFEGLLQQGHVDEEFMTSLKHILPHLQSVAADEATVIQKMILLLEGHLELRKVMDGFESRRKRILCLNKLMTFFVEEVRLECREVEYVQQLVAIYLESHVYLEAGLLMKSLAQRLLWTQKVAPKTPQHGDIMYESAKEATFWQALNLLQKSSAWEFGLDICGELVEFYRQQLHYDRLCALLRTQADFYNSIVQEERPPSSYYCVRFVTRTLPNYLCSGLFIYRGVAYFELNEFQQQLKADFPDYEILSLGQYVQKKEQSPEPGHRDKYIVLMKVKPVPCPPAHLSDPSVTVPPYVSKFYASNCITEFSSDRPFHKGTRDPSNEVKTLHVERSQFRTKQAVPCGSIWCPVQAETTTLLSPLEVALEAVAGKCNDLVQTTQLHRHNASADLRPFTMLLLGVLDAAVNGGIALYMKAFFNEDFIQHNPNSTKDLESLKSYFKTLLTALEDGLSVHGEKLSSEIRHLHERLLECFQVMRNNIEKLDNLSLANEEQTLPMEEIYIRFEEVYASVSGSTEVRSRVNTNEDLLSLPQSRRDSRANSMLPDPKSALDALSNAIQKGSVNFLEEKEGEDSDEFMDGTGLAHVGEEDIFSLSLSYTESSSLESKPRRAPALPRHQTSGFGFPDSSDKAPPLPPRRTTSRASSSAAPSLPSRRRVGPPVSPLTDKPPVLPGRVSQSSSMATSFTNLSSSIEDNWSSAVFASIHRPVMETEYYSLPYEDTNGDRKRESDEITTSVNREFRPFS